MVKLKQELSDARLPKHYVIAGLLLAACRPAMPEPIDVEFPEVRSTSFVVEWSSMVQKSYKISIERNNSMFSQDNPVSVTSPYLVKTTTSGGAIEPSTTYKIRIQVVNSIKSENRSHTFLLETAPPAPSVVRVSDNHRSHFKLSWNHSDPRSKTTRYRVICRSANGREIITKTTGGTTTATTMSRLVDNTHYKISVVALTSSANVSSDESPSLLTETAPGIPKVSLRSPIGPSADNKTMIKVDWTKPEGGDAVTTYTVEWFRFDDSKYFKTIRHSKNSDMYSYTIQGLTPGGTYRVRVKSTNFARSGRLSTSISRTTVPNSVKNLKAFQNREKSNKEIHVTGIRSWALEARSRFNKTSSVEADFSSTTATLHVVPGCNYSIDVIVYSRNISSECKTLRISSSQFDLEPILE
ncbi:unnamed protein product [Clavelina lepadiformis]|uniref:Fibronectin type-III domain-containing protein n=1 Tax=Clavelina lepadiformis TaxID=159417 RepID=A0ABP0G126_CLALP